MKVQFVGKLNIDTVAKKLIEIADRMPELDESKSQSESSSIGENK